MPSEVMTAAIPEPTRSSDRRGESVRRLWESRDLILSLVRRDLKIKYQSSLLGIAWTLLNPLLTAAVLILVFSHVVTVKVDDYWAFLVSGFFAWNFVQQSLYHATAILSNYGSLNRAVYFPREVLIVSATLMRLAEFVVEIAIVIVLVAVFHHGALPPQLLLLPWVVAILFLLTIGLMLPLAILSVFFHDMQQALPVILMTMFYLSPVFYPIEMIPEVMRPIYYLNPFVSVVQLFHLIIYSGAWPTPTLLGLSTLAAIVICAGGYAIFNRYKDVCVEIA